MHKYAHYICAFLYRINVDVLYKKKHKSAHYICALLSKNNVSRWVLLMSSYTHLLYA